jgi:7-cyano-7-deazaguanine reductase
VNRHASPLGRRVDYPDRRDPSLLYPVDREENRRACRVDDRFHGFDAWHAHEAGFITRAGLPVTGVLKIVYPADTPFLVESKSLKLYLNSLNMTPLGDDARGGIEQFTRIVRDDLSRVLHAPVAARFFEEPPEGVPPFDFDDYAILEKSREVYTAAFTATAGDPALLLEDARPAGKIKVGSHLLRGRCKITRQPDWGSVYIHLAGERVPSPLALARYIVSLRREEHFHEEMCEMIYQRLADAFTPELLAVTCLYTRRGGIDICPARASDPACLPRHLRDTGTLTRKTFRQ